MMRRKYLWAGFLSVATTAAGSYAWLATHKKTKPKG